jgi:hypothetical protein
MVVIWGQRMYGRVDRFAGSHIATRFFHIYWLPLIPLSSWLVLEEHAEGRFTGLQLPLALRSIALAWLRVASIVALCMMGVRALSFPSDLEAIRMLSPRVVNELHLVGHFITNVLFTIGLATTCFFSWRRFGRLSREEKAERVVYSDFTGRFVDVALLGEQRGLIKQRTVEELERHLVKHATAGYREAPQSSWREVATRPDQRDVPLLRAALTRSRIECVEARGAARREHELTHGRIFRNLVAAAPELLTIEKYELGV